MKTALVLEGGGMRGAYTCGVLDYLLEKEIYFDAVIGVSAGACHACSFVSRQKGRALRTVTTWLQDKRYMSVKSLVQTGNLFNAQFIYYDIPNKYDKFDFVTFNNSKTRMYAVCTDCETGKPLYFPIAHAQEDIEYIRASSSLPLVSKIVEYNGFKMLDGGISDSIPFEHMMKLGYDKIMVVTTQPEDYTKKENSLMPLIDKAYKDYPNLVDALQKRHIMYNEQTKKLKELNEAKQIFAVYPTAPLQIGRIEKNPEKITDIYQLGYEDMENKYIEFIQYFNKDGAK